MANTINDLYLKYANKVGRTLESDRYFQYLFEVVQAGDNTFQQKYQVMHKVVDERWIATIEESLDAINEIIDKPRRFVTTKEEVVPVALAKKITADSVRHLSMNTQFIASSKDGDIQPTRILNVSTEESYNLYENRFIYHLIQRLVTFIDKRTDVIFWATGDETQNVLNFESRVDDAYEEINYKIEMTVKNRQSFAENESDNMALFMRIDRVRRMVMSLKHSSFCDIMSGCSKVRSPIQRTNLIMKDPNYRTCYKLWQFLENYDEVGYTIEVQDRALEFDEEYVLQMYTNLITNYTIFKSLTDGDPRRLEEVVNQKRRLLKPKFIKKIKEEFVDDRNIEDVEIRRVFVEEVTQAQLDAEAALAAEQEARKQAEQALEDMDAQMIALQQQVSNLMVSNQEAEVRAEEERIAKEEALQAKEEADKAKEEAESAKEAAIQAAGEAKDAQAAAEESARTQIAAAKTQAEEQIAVAKAQAEEQIAAMRARADQEIMATKAQAQDEIAAAKAQTQEQITAMRSQADQEIMAAKAQAQDEIAAAKAQTEEQIAAMRAQADQEITAAKAQAQDEIAAAKAQAEAEVLAAEDRAEESRRQAQEVKADAQRRIADALKRAEDTKSEAARLQAEAEANIARIRQEKDTLEAQSRQMQESLKQQLSQTGEELERSRKQAETQRSASQAEIEGLKAQLTEQAETLRAQNEADIADIKQQAKEKLEEEKHTSAERTAQLERRISDLKGQLEEANTTWENLESRLAETEKEVQEAREQARIEKERADARTLSHYIISAFGGKKHKNNGNGDDY